MNQALPSRVATEIRVEMARQRVNQVVLAQKTGLSQSYISRRLVGTATFDLDDLERIADALGVPVGHFLRDPASAA